MNNDNLPNLDLLDSPEKLEQKRPISYKLVYIELSFLLFFALLSFLGFSVLTVPPFALTVIIYGAVAPFIKPQFTKPRSFKIGLGIWNLFHLAFIVLGAFFMIKGMYGASLIVMIGLMSLSFYYFVLPFVESDRINSLRFLTLLLFGGGFSCFIVGLIFKFDNWPYTTFFLTMGPFLAGISCSLMLFQLLKDRKQHYYYWFYIPRILALLVSWLLSM